jgi:anti-sigma factor RsiW
MHIEDDRLQEYVDGRLGDADREQVERHLAACEECAGAERELRDLLAQVAALPRDIAPSRDLRPPIHTAIARRARRPADFGSRTLRSARGTLMAAAIALVVFSSGLTALLMRGRGGTIGEVQPASAGAEFRVIEANYIAATNELEVALEELRAVLPPEAVRIIEENLAIIDGALAEASTALAADPHNPALSEMLVAAYQKKLDLLRRAVDVPRERGVL